MKVLIVGGSGMLGHKLVQVLQSKFDLFTTLRSRILEYRKFDVFNSSKTFENVDVENFESVETVLTELRPDVVVNAVGIIKQVPSTKSVIKTLTTNALFPHRLAEITARTNTRLINISTDCVFSGKKGNYAETDASDAEDLYGKSKHLGEVTDANCLTIRTSIIGRELNTSHSLLEWFFGNKKNTIRGYRRAIFSGFPTLILAEIISDLIENHPQLNGLYHVSSDPINKFDLLNLVKDAYDVNIEIEPFDDFAIDRSLDSTKFRTATKFNPVVWKEMIDRMRNDDSSHQNKN